MAVHKNDPRNPRRFWPTLTTRQAAAWREMEAAFDAAFEVERPGVNRDVCACCNDPREECIYFSTITRKRYCGRECMRADVKRAKGGAA
jgi:hypothetical protein